MVILKQTIKEFEDKIIMLIEDHSEKMMFSMLEGDLMEAEHNLKYAIEYEKMLEMSRKFKSGYHRKDFSNGRVIL